MSAAQTSGRTNGAQPYIVCDNLVKIYKTEDLEVVALQGLDLEVQRGEMMAIIGNSGSGQVQPAQRARRSGSANCRPVPRGRSGHPAGLRIRPG